MNAHIVEKGHSSATSMAAISRSRLDHNYACMNEHIPEKDLSSATSMVAINLSSNVRTSKSTNRHIQAQYQQVQKRLRAMVENGKFLDPSRKEHHRATSLIDIDKPLHQTVVNVLNYQASQNVQAPRRLSAGWHTLQALPYHCPGSHFFHGITPLFI